MRRFFTLFLAFLLCMNFIASAQFQRKNFELGFSGSMGYINSESNNSSFSSSYDGNYICLSLMPGYYVADGFSIEPEFAVTASKDMEPGLSLLGNLSYTFFRADRNFGIFARIGYGLSNSMSIPNISLLNKATEDMDISVFNLGGGFKFLIGSSVYVRTELNYRNYNWSKSGYDNNSKIISILLGLGIII